MEKFRILLPLKDGKKFLRMVLVPLTLFVGTVVRDSVIEEPLVCHHFNCQYNRCIFRDGTIVEKLQEWTGECSERYGDILKNTIRSPLLNIFDTSHITGVSPFRKNSTKEMGHRIFFQSRSGIYAKICNSSYFFTACQPKKDIPDPSSNVLNYYKKRYLNGTDLKRLCTMRTANTLFFSLLLGGMQNSSRSMIL